MGDATKANPIVISGPSSQVNGGAGAGAINGEVIFTVTPTGSINITSGGPVPAVLATGDNNRLIIDGTVDSNAFGIVLGTFGSESNSGLLSIGGVVNTMVEVRGNGNSINVTNKIVNAVSNADGISLLGNDNTVNVIGSVRSLGDGVFSVGDGLNLNLSATGTIAAARWGAYNEGNSSTTVISGGVSVSDDGYSGVYNKGNQNVTLIYGSVTTVGNPNTVNPSRTFYGDGVINEGNNNSTIVSGMITTYGDSASAVHNIGDSNSVTVTGTLASLGTNPIAIRNNGSNNTYTIAEGSRLVGAIQSDGGTNNTLRFDLGASKSYVFETTGDWILEDMSGRAVVEGSAMAAGVGRAETADEMLFERTQLFLQSIDRGQMRRDLAGDSALWVDPYAFDAKRSASSSDPTVMKYGSNGYGLTLGYDFQAFGLKAQAIGNIQWGKLNIDDNTQDVNNTSWLVGLRLPSFYEAGPVSFSAMAFAGRNQYSGDSQVLTNSTSTGTTTYSSSYGSTQLLFGLGAKYATPLTQSTDLSVKADLYLSQEYMESYQEGPYFSWNSRTLTQGSAFVEIGIDHYLTDPWLIQAKVGANTQTLFSGKDTNYTINNTAVTFSGGQTNDTGLYAMLGTQYQVKDNARVGLSVWYGQSNNSVKTIQGMVEAKFLF